MPLLTAGCNLEQAPTLGDAKQAVCQSLVALREGTTRLTAISPDTTVAELRNVRNNLNTLVEAARTANTVMQSQAITDIVEAGAKFHELKTAGAALAFDDFGAGFSSLTNLQSFEFDYLKIDKSFVEGLARGGDNAKIGRAIAQLR